MRKPSGTGWSCPTRPRAWGWGSQAYLLVGALAHSGRWRGCAVAESMDQPHLVDGLDRVTRALGGVTAGVAVRPDGHRRATRRPGRITASFAAVAKHYGVSVAICPPRRGNRKGVVEKANHTAAQRWWRTLADDVTVEQAQSVAGPLVRPASGDARLRATADGKATVATARRARAAAPGAAGAVPGDRHRSRGRSRAQALVAFRGNRYSVATRARRRHGHRAPAGSAPATSTSPPPPGS